MLRKKLVTGRALFLLICLCGVQTNAFTVSEPAQQTGSLAPIEANYDLHLSELPSNGWQEEHSHNTYLDHAGVMLLRWTPHHTKQEVTWTLEARTLGWIGFGINSNGGMDGADIVTAWVKDGRLYLQDRHGDKNNLPPQDTVGNWRPIAAHENDTHTVITLVRSFNTCDEDDFPLTNETTRFIHAWGPTDPEGDDPPYHGTRRGAKMALTLLPFHQSYIDPSSYETWKVNQSVKMPNGRETFYWCHIEKVPAAYSKRLYIGFSMVYGHNARDNLHHSVSFECQSHSSDRSTEESFEKYVGHPGFECYTPNMPDEYNACSRFLINWVIGSEGEMLPEHVGVPLGERHGGASYVMFQTHYDNPTLKKNVVVDWAMDIYHTDILRQYEAGNMGLGQAINFGLTVPPGVRDWTTAGHCSEHCTSTGLPPEGVNIFMVFLHGHYLAREIRLRHFRNGEELPNIALDRHFDADFQQSRRLSEEVKLLPGDHLTVECLYDSTLRKKGTFSGWEARDEMCQAFINYYPRINMALCRSTPTVDTINKALGINTIPSDVDLAVFTFDFDLLDGRRYKEVVNSMPWSNAEVRRANEIMRYGEHFIKCEYNALRKMEVGHNITRYPHHTPYRPPLDAQCQSLLSLGDQRVKETLQQNPSTNPSANPSTNPSVNPSANPSQKPFIDTNHPQQEQDHSDQDQDPSAQANNDGTKYNYLVDHSAHQSDHSHQSEGQEDALGSASGTQIICPWILLHALLLWFALGKY